MNQFYYIQLRHTYGAGFTFLTNFLVTAWKTIHENTLEREHYFSGYGKEKLQLYRLCRPCSFSIPQAWPCPALQMPTAHAAVPPMELPCACYRKEEHLFSDMSLLKNTSETFICKRSVKTEDPCLKTG